MFRRLLGFPGLRRLSTEADARAGTLSRWLQEWMPLPQVVVTEGTELPTALSWLRRRGPPLPESTLHRLFRQESIRLWDPAAQRVRRVSKGRLLEPGCMLLLPNSAVAAAATPGQQPADAQQQQQLSPVARRQRVAAAQDLRACLLHIDADLLAVNKPAGLATQGGRGIAHSVDSLMGEAFRGLPGLDPARLRLVHRLDRQTTGVLLIARNPDAAAWLSAAFRDGSAEGGGSGSTRGSSSSGSSSRGSASQPRAGAPSIAKTYWAILSRQQEEALEGGASSGSRRGGRASSGRAAGWLPPAGTVSLPVPGNRDPGQLQPARTHYRVLHQSGGLAWVELQPLTGRKHQLRRHCVDGLGAAVLGDERYGALRSAGQQAALEALQGAAGGGPPLFLHCRSLEVVRPGHRQGSLRLTAPLPDAWRRLLERQGWPLPPDSPS